MGRGIALLQELERISGQARAGVSRHWRAARSRGLSANQLAHMREQLATWAQLSPEERRELETRLVSEAGLPADAFGDLLAAAMVERWSRRVRETNGALSAVEVRIQERRAQVARVEEGRAAGAGGDRLRAAESQAAGAEEEIAALSQRCRDLQCGLVQEILADGVETVPDLIRTFVAQGIFLPQEVQDYQGLCDVAGAIQSAAG